MSENPRPPGRPPQGPKSGKGHVLTTRITAETRAALEAEAERTGRSISQVAEIWLDDARNGRADLRGLLGGTQLAASIERLVQIAKDVQAVTKPDVWHSALLAAWTSALPSVVPYEGRGVSPIKIQAQSRNVWEACQAMLAVIDTAPADDPVRVKLYAPAGADGGGSILAHILRAELHGHWDLGPALHRLAEAGPTARAEIQQAIMADLLLEIMMDERRAQRAEAERAGRDIAAANTSGAQIGEAI